MNAEEKMSRRDELEALLPFYVNGTLAGADLEAVEAWLESDPDAMAALAEAEMEFAENGAANEAIRPPADALSRFSSALEHEAGPARARAGTSWFTVAWHRVASLPAGVGWAVAAAAIAVVLLQAVSGDVFQKSDYKVAGTHEDLSKQPFALVVFKPDATMADITAFLSRNSASIVSGPTAGGVFRVAIATKTAAEYDRIVQLIADQPFADKVSQGKRPANGS
jgi:anti-sigma-K factor RskA